MSEENDFIDWQGGPCPVDGDTLVEVKLSGSAGMPTRCARAFNWKHNNYSGNVVAYRVVEAPKPKVEIPEGFTPWAGGARPVAPDTGVDVLLRGGTTSFSNASNYSWRPHRDAAEDIIAYRVVETQKPKVETPEGFTPWAGGERPIDKHTMVQLRLRNGRTPSGAARECRWNHLDSGEDVVAYRVVEEEKPKVEIPEGFTPWNGGDRPVGARDKVQVVLRNGATLPVCNAGAYGWWLHNDPDEDIIAYRVILEKPQFARDTQVGGDHYKTPTVQPWDVVDTWPIEQQIGFHRGNALKYVMRMGTKDENLREIRKAAHYLQKLTEVLEQKGGV